jgi:hypothetical protein
VRERLQLNYNLFDCRKTEAAMVMQYPRKRTQEREKLVIVERRLNCPVTDD